MKTLLTALTLLLLAAPLYAQQQETTAETRTSRAICRTAELLRLSDEVERKSGLDGWREWMVPRVEEGGCVVPEENYPVAVIGLDLEPFNEKEIVGVLSERWEGQWYAFREELR